MSRLPDFITIGAMKCATSTLHDQLAAQEGIFMSDPKEPCFFSNDEVYAQGLDWYAGLFDAAADGDLCGESSTHYTKLPTYPHTVERMRGHLPDVRLIYVMRHPIDRLVSHYIHDWTERKIDSPIDEAVDGRPELVAYSRYAMQLEPFLSAYGPERILPVFFERLVAEPQTELERVCRFLGYPNRPSHQADLRANASSRRLRTSRVRDAIVCNPVSTFVRRRFIPQAWRDRVKSLWQMKRRPALGPGRTAQLTEVFNQDLEKLGDWFGVELSCESFKSTARAELPEWRRAVMQGTS